MTRCLLATMIILWSAAAYAADPWMRTLPDVGGVSLYGTIDVVIQGEPYGLEVDTAQAYLNFDATYFQVISITAGGAPLGVVLQNSYDNTAGFINYAAGTLSNFPTATFTLATVRLTGIAESSGDLPIAFNIPTPRRSALFRSGAVLPNFGLTGSWIGVDSATPSPTATRTRTVTPTRTRTPTQTPGGPSPTPTPTPQACCGDCDGNRAVTIAEYQTCWSIFVGAPLLTCPACDCNGDGVVDLTETNRVIVNSQSGCPVAPLSVPAVAANSSNGDEDLVVYRQLRCQGTTERPCWHTTLLYHPPPAPLEGDVWFQSEAGVRKVCLAEGGQQYCAVLSAQ